jgi:hypothetical protein
MASNESDLNVGDVLEATYRLDDKIGEGLMGRVYRATDIRNFRRAAVKVLFSANLDAETQRRFDHETQVLQALDHAGIVQVLAAGRTRNIPWLAMPLLEGHDLTITAAQHSQGRVPPDVLLPIVRQILEALTYLHGRGVVYSDLKPTNIHVGSKGRITLCDFGLSRGRKTTLARTGVVWGSPEYLAPEQILGERVLDGRADLYGLSAVVYRMLSGGPVFAEGSDQELLRAHLGRPRPDISRRVPGLSPLLGAALTKGLAIDPEDRFQSADEMLATLDVALTVPIAAARGKGPAPMLGARPAGGIAGIRLGTPEGQAVTKDEDDDGQMTPRFPKLIIHPSAMVTPPAGYPGLPMSASQLPTMMTSQPLGAVGAQPTIMVAPALADTVDVELDSDPRLSKIPRLAERIADESAKTETGPVGGMSGLGGMVAPRPSAPLKRAQTPASALPTIKDVKPSDVGIKETVLTAYAQVRNSAQAAPTISAPPVAPITPLNPSSATQVTGPLPTMSTAAKIGIAAAVTVALAVLGLVVAKLMGLQ